MPHALKLALTVLALAPSTAQAATYYVTPAEQEGADCSQSQPCDFNQAKELAGSGDEIEMGAGTYVGPFSSGLNVKVYGAPGTRPKITAVAEPAFAISAGSLSHVEVDQTSAGAHALFAENATVDNVIARSTGTGGVAMFLQDGSVVRSSAALAPGADGRAIQVSDATGGARLHGVTAGAAGVGLLVTAMSNDSRVTAVNSILRGADFDVRLVDEVSITAQASLDHSAFRTGKVEGLVTDLGGNIGADPLLDADGIHQQVASPTRNAGRADANAATTDVDGEARSQNAAPDIGADERANPEPPPPDATATPGPSPAPEPAPEPAPTVTPLDLTLPGFLSVKFTTPPVAGRITNLVIEAFDPDSRLLGVIIDLGPFGYVGHLACTNLGGGAPGARQRFTIPVLFNAPGLQSYAVEVRSGGCDGTPQGSRTELTSQVGAGAMVARIAQVPPARCASSLRPKAGNEAQLATAVVCLINQQRKKKRLKLLRVNKKLIVSARAQGSDMLRRRYYNHQRPGGPSLKARARKARYRGDTGENLGLASGSLATPAAMMRAWLASPPHRANILHRRFRAIGVHVTARDPLKRMSGAGLYTINFGTKK